MKALIIDDKTDLYQIVEQFPELTQCDLFHSKNTTEILKIIQDKDIQIVFYDWDNDSKIALSLLNQINNMDILVDVIFVGKSLSSQKVMELINQGLTEYITKPLSPKLVLDSLKRIHERRKLRSETYQLEKRLAQKYLFQGIVGKNPYMLEIFSLIEKIAQYFTTVLITGETGTGKEMIAKAIHALSKTKNRNLVIMDCVSIPDTLFESELFGYKRGAFTGADKDKKGLFEEAHKGIIFLDEIGDIPFPTQSKLLRLLDHHEFRPLGSTETRTADVKIIAATNRNLRESVKNGSFREDLFHRINKVTIHLPPLREKPEDIPLLVRYFLDRFNAKFSKDIKGISRQVQKLFLKHSWPGNVRELDNVMERSVMLCEKDFVDVDDLTQDLQTLYTSKSQIPFINKDKLSTLDELEKDYIRYLLDTTKYNLKETASILKISRTTLYNKPKNNTTCPMFVVFMTPFSCKGCAI